MFTSSSPISASQTQTSPDQPERLRIAARKGWTPPPRISVPDWADRYRKLAREAGSTSGNWRTSTVEAGRGPMLAVTEPGVHIIDVMVCTQLLKTSFLENTWGYFAHLDPCPFLLVQPKEEAAEAFSKERITPLIKSTPVLRKLVGTTKMRSGEESLTFKPYPGGYLALVGAGSPDNLARRPVRVVAYDEVDKYPVTREGDPISLGDERTATFVSWLSLRACSPTIDDESRIAACYAESDQRRASATCPHCGHRNFLEFFKHVHWDKDGGVHKTKTARIYCEGCGAGWEEGDRLRALQTTRWHQTRAFTCCGERHDPLVDYDKATAAGIDGIAAVWDWWEGTRYAVYRAKCPTCAKWGVDNEHAGFQCSKLFSPWRRDQPASIAAKWIAAKDDEEKKQTFFNTQLGLTYRPHAGKELKLETLAARGEIWAAEVPDGVAVVTVGVDVQDYRVELEVTGWGKNEESWSLAYEIFDGEFEDPKTQAALDLYLKKKFVRADGREFVIEAACVDSGGHHTQAVYDFCKARLGRRVWAIKGESARTGQRNPVWPAKRPTSRTKKAFRPIIIGVNAAKDSVRQRLYLDQAGAGYMHFPHDRDINYYAQILAERSVLKIVSGQKFRVWELPSGKANEALDCRVYAYAALCGLLHFGLKLNRRAEEATITITPSAAKPGVDVEMDPVIAAREQGQAGPSIKQAPDAKSSITRRLA
ncbi:MAG TPA: terminase gpA endonuclease subunit [Rhizomicrobium sp.]|jgi:phage terminase large subunit GpA-like protein|nr:terminase gpA endonuclease subunit [Rhizomicrobium sp.]